MILNVTLNNQELNYLKPLICAEIQMLYDDPNQHEPVQLHEDLRTLKSLCEKLKLNLEEIILEESTQTERDRVNEMLKISTEKTKYEHIVKIGKDVARSFHLISDDYAITNAREYVRKLRTLRLPE
jgi:hypothetical protein